MRAASRTITTARIIGQPASAERLTIGFLYLLYFPPPRSSRHHAARRAVFVCARHNNSNGIATVRRENEIKKKKILKNIKNYYNITRIRAARVRYPSEFVRIFYTYHCNTCVCVCRYCRCARTPPGATYSEEPRCCLLFFYYFFFLLSLYYTRRLGEWNIKKKKKGHRTPVVGFFFVFLSRQ